MPRTRRTLCLIIASLFGTANCTAVTESILCTFGIGTAAPASLTLNVGASASTLVALAVSPGCQASDLAATTSAVTSANTAIATATASQASATFSAAVNVTGVAPGVTSVTLRMTYANGTSPSPVIIPVTVVAPPPTTGDVRIVINGLPAGVNGNVDVGSALTTIKNYTVTATQAFPPANYGVSARNVTAAGGQVYVPTPEFGLVTVVVGQLVTYTVTYAAQVVQTGSLQVVVAGNLPVGTNADILVTGPGAYSRALNGSTTITNLPVGTYNVATRDVVTAERDFGSVPVGNTPPPLPAFVVDVGATTVATSTYQTIRRATTVVFGGTLAPSGATSVQFGMSGQTYTSTNTVPTVKLPLGTLTVTVPDRVVNGATFRPVPGSISVFSVADGSTILQLLLAFYCSGESFEYQSATSLFTDPFNNAPAIGMWTTNRLLIALSYPVVFTGNIIATMTASGPAPFVTVTGNWLLDRTFTLNGNSGTTAVGGFQAMPAQFTGSLSNSRVITSGRYQLGQLTMPMGFPGGPTIFNLTGTPVASPPLVVAPTPPK
jgi:hypothetical protein